MAEILKSRTAKAVTRLSWQSLMLCQAVSLGMSPLLPLVAMAQVPAAPVAPAPATTGANIGGTTILPTDVVPLTDREAYKTPFGELLQLKIMQRLPARLYFSSSVEVSGRDETNPFQFPTKRTLEAQLPKPAQWRILPISNQVSLYNILGETGRNNPIFRVLPNVSGGWTITPHTRLFTNYFMIRDQLSASMRLNTVIHSYAIGLQQDHPLGPKGSAQVELQGRELWQLHQQSVFDFLPGLTLSYIATPRLVVFANALMQIRAKSVFEARSSMKELDPFYTWGGLYQKNGWTFSVSSTFVENFREPFHHNAVIPKNSYVMISDFEIARRIVKQYPGLQAFMRAEPIWNFHSHDTPSLAGMDFRMFFGMRFAMAKPPLTATLQQIREQLKQETEPQGPATKPSAELPTEPEISMNPQPIHGFLEAATFAETCQLPEGEMPVIADNENPADESNAAASLMAQEGGADDSMEAATGVEGKTIADSESSTASPEPGRTLDEIASSSPASSGNSPAASADGQSNIMDLSKAQIDWKDVAGAQAPGIDSNNLRSIVDKAAEQSNAIAQQQRVQKLRDMSEKQEQEYKLAMAPAPMAMPAPAAVPFKPTAAPLPSGLKSVSTPSAAAAPVKRALEALQPSSLAAGASAPAQPSPHVNSNPALAFIYVPPKPVLPTHDAALSTKLMQPLQKQAESRPTYTADLRPSSAKRESRKSAGPVPVAISKLAASPNAMPAPVSAKLAKPVGVLPSVKGESKPTAAELAAASTDKKPAHYQTNKDGSIALSELKVDTSTGGSAITLEAQKPGESSFHQNTAHENELLLASAKLAPRLNAAPVPQFPVRNAMSNIITPPSGRPVISSSPLVKNQTVANKKAATPSVVMPSQPPQAAQPAPQVDSSVISGLEDSDLSSPKIAMAVYDSWQSPVMDDPLIEDAPRKYAGKSSYVPATTSSVRTQQKVQSEKKRTEMRLIPPFPAARDSKDGPFKDLKIPVLPR